MPESIDQLIQRLGEPGERGRREAGDVLLRMGSPAVRALAEALGQADPEVRKPAAFLLGRAGDGSAPVLAALQRALGDPEAKVRKNAAVALGRLGATSAMESLARALSAEEMLWVRSSMVLALGALGAPAAGALCEVVPRGEEEAEALRKALDRAGGETRTVRWRNDGRLPVPPYLTVPPGLEAVAVAEAVERGIPTPVRVRPGELACADVPFSALFPALRCIHAVRYPLGSGPSLFRLPEADLPRRIGSLLANSTPLDSWRDWIDAPGSVFRYRFSLGGLRVSRPTLRSILAEVRATLRPLGLEDSPSSYAAELQVEVGRDGSYVMFTPTFIPDDRFAYRVADVGASINPVVGACIARLARTPGAALALDPTCGSATLLVERAKLDASVRCRGADVSPTAVRAAGANVQAAGLAERIEIVLANSADPGAWTQCDEVLANLPFGLRTGQRDGDRGRLYSDVVANMARALRPGGRAVLYTTDRAPLQAALEEQSRALRVEQTLRTRSGGLDVGVWVVARR
jgi:predicted RNA methylase